MKIDELDKPERGLDKLDQKIELEKERLEIKLKEMEDSFKIPLRVQEGDQLIKQKLIKRCKMEIIK